MADDAQLTEQDIERWNTWVRNQVPAQSSRNARVVDVDRQNVAIFVGEYAPYYAALFEGMLQALHEKGAERPPEHLPVPLVKEPA